MREASVLEPPSNESKHGQWNGGTAGEPRGFLNGLNPRPSSSLGRLRVFGCIVGCALSFKLMSGSYRPSEYLCVEYKYRALIHLLRVPYIVELCLASAHLPKSIPPES